MRDADCSFAGCVGASLDSPVFSDARSVGAVPLATARLRTNTAELQSAMLLAGGFGDIASVDRGASAAPFAVADVVVSVRMPRNAPQFVGLLVKAALARICSSLVLNLLSEATFGPHDHDSVRGMVDGGC